MEEVFLAKGLIPPSQKRKRNQDKEEGTSGGGYKGKKNKLDEKGLPMKCFNYKCDCTINCNHPCRYHFSNNCSKRKEGGKSNKAEEKDKLTNFVETNIPHVLFTTTSPNKAPHDRLIWAEQQNA